MVVEQKETGIVTEFEYESDGTAAIVAQPSESVLPEDSPGQKVLEITAPQTQEVQQTQDVPLTQYVSKKKKGFRYNSYLFFKRAFDIVSSGLVLLVISLPLILCMLIKWLEDCFNPVSELLIEEADPESKKAKGVTRLTRKDGKVFDCRLVPVKKNKGDKRLRRHSPIYTSERVGMGGKKIRFYKMRSMCPNAEAMKKQLIDAGLNEADEPAFKIKNDPRITPFGKFLRKTSIDELPQLLNIFKGDMSVVGPRPPIPSEVEQYNEEQMHRLDVKGGLLCLWQITKNRNSLSFDEWVKLDLEYIEKQSFWLDLKIIFKGAFMVVFDHSGE